MINKLLRPIGVNDFGMNKSRPSLIKRISKLPAILRPAMPKKAASKSTEPPELHHFGESWEEKYEQLQQAYRNVCLERDLLRKAVKMYADYQGENVQRS